MRALNLILALIATDCFKWQSRQIKLFTMNHLELSMAKKYEGFVEQEIDLSQDFDNDDIFIEESFTKGNKNE
jgi:hypothetical protein